MAKAKSPADPILASLKKALSALPDLKPLTGAGALFTARQAALADEAVRLGYLDRQVHTHQGKGGRQIQVVCGALTEAGIKKALETDKTKAPLESLLLVLQRLGPPPAPPTSEAFRVELDKATTICVGAIREAFGGLQRDLLKVLMPTSAVDPAPILAALRSALEKVEPVIIRIPAATQPVSPSAPPTPPPPPVAVNPGLDLKALGDEIVSLVEQSVRERSVGYDFGELFDELKRRHPALSIGTFQDTLRILDEAGRIRLSGWSRMLDDMPRPELALFISHKVMYHAHPAP